MFGTLGKLDYKWDSNTRNHRERYTESQILHQMRSFSSGKAIQGLNLSCFSEFGALEQFAKVGSNDPKCSTAHFLNEVLLECNAI